MGLRVLAPLTLVILACTTVTQLPELILRTSPTPTPTARPTAEPTPFSTPSPSAPADAELAELEQQAITLRGLRPDRPLSRTILQESQLRRRILDDFLADYTREEAEVDVRVLALFQLVEPDLDLRSLYQDLYVEQLAGYYDPEAEAMFVVAGGSWTGVERLTYVHEFTHVLQDQTFDLEKGLGYSDEECEDNGERCSAIAALIEGDASLLQEQWLRTYARQEDLADLLSFVDDLETPVFDSAPAYLQEDFLFPYEQGLEFVRSIYLRDGWSGVDELYRRPPESTEQILHPALYPRATPAPAAINDLAAALGEDWQEIARDVLGEWYTRLMLQTQLDEVEAGEAAAGWGGDEYVVLADADTGRDALVLVSVWDRPRDAFEFITAMIDRAEGHFGETTAASDGATWTWEEGRVVLVRAYTQTLWIVAPDAETAALLHEAVDFPLTR
jgi:hypothetical protein